METYTETARWPGDRNPASRRVIEGLLQKEKEHAEDMATLLGRMPQDA